MAINELRNSSNSPRARLKRWTPWLIMLGFWIAIDLPPLYRGARFALEPDVMCDDVRIVQYHFFHWMDSALFANDALGKYHADGTSDLYRVLYFVVAKLYDPYAFTKLTPFLLYAITLMGIGSAAKRLGGRAAVFVAITICLGSSLMLNRMSGVLPRAFAYPILAWMAAALVAGRIRTLALLTILGAGLYPVLTLLGGGALATTLLLLPRRDRGSAARWSFKRRCSWLTATALCCALITAPFVMRMRPYGAAITPAMIAEFPEAGPGGRQDSQTRPPFAPLHAAWKTAAAQALTGSGSALLPPLGGFVLAKPKLKDAWLNVTYALAVLGWLSLLIQRYSAVRRLTAFAVAIGVSYVVANAVTPILVVPPRYTLYGVPILMVLVVAAAPLGLLPRRWLRRCRSIRVRSPWLVLGFGVITLAGLGTNAHGNPGVARFAQPGDQPLFAAIARLPKASLIAGWPIGAMETMPILSRRTPFLTRQIHVPYHTDMTLRMRHRMQRLIAAYYASDVEPLRQLRDEFAVTHLVVEQSKLEQPGRYFRPFGASIEQAFERGQATGFAVTRLRESAAVFDDGKQFILDLSKLPPR